MLSRAFNTPKRSPKKTPKDGYQGNNSKSQSSIDDYEDDCIAGWFMDDLPLIFCKDNDHDHHLHRVVAGGGEKLVNCESCGSHGHQTTTLREVLRCSVGVIGESRLGMTEKVVLLGGRGKVYAVKRFRKVSVRKREFGRRIERLAQISRRCNKYLVPVTAYLYTKRIKFVLFDYFPMGTLSDLLSGGRERGHATLDWNQRLTIILHIAQAISFIHNQFPPLVKNMQMNVHGNIKPSNVMINLDFTARLSDYGFAQLAERVDVSDTGQPKPPPSPEKKYYSDKLCQTGDIYNFGVIVLDMLGGAEAPDYMHCILENKEEIKSGLLDFFEFAVEGKDRKQALLVLEIALACTNRLVEVRPTMEQIMLKLGDVLSYR